MAPRSGARSIAWASCARHGDLKVAATTAALHGGPSSLSEGRRAVAAGPRACDSTARRTGVDGTPGTCICTYHAIERQTARRCDALCVLQPAQGDAVDHACLRRRTAPGGVAVDAVHRAQRRARAVAGRDHAD